MNQSKVKSIVPVAVTILLFAVAAFISYSNNSSTPQPYQENAARLQLWTLFQSCKMFWNKEGSEEECTLETASQSPYTFSLDAGERVENGGEIEVELASGFPETFSATASHVASHVVWSADATGQVKCLQFSPDDCERLTHFDREEMIDEAREWGGTVDDDANYIYIR